LDVAANAVFSAPTMSEVSIPLVRLTLAENPDTVSVTVRVSGVPSSA
jgi:hypothetical protein